LAVDELHCVEANAIVFPEIEDADDIRVMQAGRRAGLEPESADALRIGPEAPTFWIGFSRRIPGNPGIPGGAALAWTLSGGNSGT